MIALSKYYNFSAEEVEYIEVSDSNKDYPYRLTVHFKSGQACSVNYTDSQSRENARAEIVRRVEYQKRADTEKIQNSLYLIRSELSRIDKRELRIWRQLRDLLGLRVEED